MFNEAYIMPTISQGLRMKYMALLSNSTYVPKWMAEKTVADQNSIASFSYVTVPYSSITDSTIKVTDEEIKSYINKNQELLLCSNFTRIIPQIIKNHVVTSGAK